MGIRHPAASWSRYLERAALSRAQDNHKLYKQKLEELTKLQDGISSSIARQKKRLKELSLSLKK